MPQKICYLDAFSGVSGDMLVGALAGAGVDRQALVSALDSLGTGATLRFEEVKQGPGRDASRRVLRGFGTGLDLLCDQEPVADYSEPRASASVFRVFILTNSPRQ